MPFSDLAMNILAMQKFIFTCNIHIAIYIVTANIVTQSCKSKFSQVQLSILSFYYTILLTRFLSKNFENPPS